MGGIFLFSRTLLPGQILHTAIDLNNGFALGKIASHLENPEAR
jgi:hypothetical protein